MERHTLLIAGPPGAGKSTLAETFAAKGYVHLEREMFDTDPAYIRAAHDTAHAHPRTVIVRCCFTLDEQQRWSTLLDATETIVVDPGRDETRRRVTQRNRRRTDSELRAVDDWYRKRNPTSRTW